MTADESNGINRTNGVDDLLQMFRVAHQDCELNLIHAVLLAHSKARDARVLLSDHAGQPFKCGVSIGQFDIEFDRIAAFVLGIPLQVAPGLRINSHSALDVAAVFRWT